MNLLAAVVLAQLGAAPQGAVPVLAFPEPGVDDSAAYQGYRTRFVRDVTGNTVQIYVNQREGRVVLLWADAANASAGFSIRDTTGAPAAVRWGGETLVAGRSAAGGRPSAAGEGGMRFVEFELEADGAVDVGRFLLGSMRLERDFQYFGGHRAPFDSAHIRQPELEELVAHLEALDPAERSRQLSMLRTRSMAELRRRLAPEVRLSAVGGRPSADGGRGSAVLVEQPTFDGRNRHRLDLEAEDGTVTSIAGGRAYRIRPAVAGQPVRLRVRAYTDAATLTPLARGEILSDAFAAYVDSVAGGGDELRARRLERQLRSLELLSSREKLMAGMPNYATYFGRDMMMSALMMESIWKPAMLEHVIASVLRKLDASGGVSHEEALGGQAIRERAAEYNGLMDARASALRGGARARADSLLTDARAVLGNLQRVRENYHMVDDDFQLPVLAARYLTNASIPAAQKRAFLLGSDEADGETRLARLLRNLAFVARVSAPYARSPQPTNLVSFARRREGGWSAQSWRDSGAGYGGGRFAMDVNAAWVPAALAATSEMLDELERLGVSAAELSALVPGDDGAALRGYLAARPSLRDAVRVWRGARRHFEVEIAPADAAARLDRWVETMPAAEQAYWRARVASVRPTEPLRFLALALDSAGVPIPVVNTDPSTLWFLEDVTEQVLRGERDAAAAIAEVESFLLPYPLGLFVAELGPLVANDVFADATVQQAFRRDHYHSPRVVWGREVNLLLLALARQLAAAYDADGRLRSPALAEYASALARAIERTRAAVEASGLKHNELWSYRIEGERLLPVRYGSSTDIQLWNVTDLAVQYELARLQARDAIR